VPDVRGAGDQLGETADGDEPAAVRCTFEEPRGDIDLDARRPPIRIRAPRLVWMCRHDVPEQHLVLDPELGEDAVDDRRARLGRAPARQLALGGERDAADPCAAVPGRLPDEDDARISPALEIRA
jgi:hypothetical protein